ncbi:MAG: hypothetical protein MJ175_03870 [Clostridia bacterium]|nr:hypothetical protein [Clostridia bacterium]
MNHTRYQNPEEHYTRPDGSGSLRDRFFAGMEHFAAANPASLPILVILSAAAACGAVAGAILYTLFGTSADPGEVERSYFAVRAFTSYPGRQAAAAFLAGWFFDRLLPLTAALLPAVTTRPRVCAWILCMVRGMVSGFVVCALSSGFSPFTLYCAAAQSGYLALIFMTSAKAVRYAELRADALKASGGKSPDPAVFLPGAVLPLLCGWLLAAFTMLVFMTAVCAVSCLII